MFPLILSLSKDERCCKRWRFPRPALQQAHGERDLRAVVVSYLGAVSLQESLCGKQL